jgi:proto-oncogene tyrosine-protein kinase Met
VSYYSDSSISCSVFFGAGYIHSAEVEVDGLTGISKGLFSYDGPRITSVTPTNAPTTANQQLYVKGSNFGVTAYDIKVYIGQFECLSSIFMGDTIVSCILAPGVDVAQVVVSRLQGLNNTYPRAFSYSMPVISSVSPVYGPTSGGFGVTMFGHNLGTFNHINFSSSIGATIVLLQNGRHIATCCALRHLVSACS